MNIAAHLHGFFRWLTLIRRYGRPTRVFHFNGGLGDQLLCSCVAREWHKRGRSPVWLLTSAPELFAENPDVAAAAPYDIWLAPWLRLNGTPIETISYNDVRTQDGIVADTPITEHIIASLCRRSGLSGTVTLRPYLPAVSPRSRVPARRRSLVAVQSSCLGAKFPLHNKQWPLDRIQAVVTTLAPEMDFVHLGGAEDPALTQAEDRRGRGSLLDAARTLAGCDLLFALEGFLMHLARAVECPAVIVHGGRGPAALFGYSCNFQVVRHPPCSPCWFYSHCDHRRICLEDIPVDEVVRAIRAVLASPPRRPLQSDTAEIGAN